MANLRSILGGLIMLLSIGVAAHACENDSQSTSAEKKMRDNYRPQNAPPAGPLATKPASSNPAPSDPVARVPAATDSPSPFVVTGIGTGAMLLLGSLAWS